MDLRAELAVRILCSIIEKEGIRADAITRGMLEDIVKEAQMIVCEDVDRALIYADALIARLERA